jgi:hypothetical protein
MAGKPDFVPWLIASRTKAQFQVNTTEMRLRGTQDGAIVAQNIVPTKQSLCDEGSYFVTTSPTPGTAIAYGAGGTQATFSDLVAFMQVINIGTPNDPTAPVVFLDYLKIITSGTQPTGSLFGRMLVKLDNGFRASTAGTPTTNIPVNTNMNYANIGPNARVITYSGAVPTTPAASAMARIVAQSVQLKGGPTLTLDEYSVSFGINDAPKGQGYLTTVAQHGTRAAPVAIGPGQSATIHMWWNTAAVNPFNYEFELAHWER